MTQLIEAIRLAHTAHAGQVDKSGAPYILHPLRVMMRGHSEREQIVGVLHDTVEDTSVTLSDINQHFDIVIAEAIDSLTRRNGESYVEFIQRCRQNRLARIVKRYDILDNLAPDRSAGRTESMTRRYTHALGLLD